MISFSSSKLIDEKIRHFLPFMLLSQVSTMLILFADSLVVGNFVGKDALAAINVAYPLSFVMCIFSIVPQFGVMSRLVFHLGKDSAYHTSVCIAAGKRLILLMALALSILQIPFPWIITRTMSLAPDIQDMSMTYMFLLMLTAPAGIFNACGVNILSAYGKMSMITWMTIGEGVLNLLFDLLFTGALDMGVAGVGLGSVLATYARCVFTFIVVNRQTPFFSTRLRHSEGSEELALMADVKKEMLEMVRQGVPSAIGQVENLVKSWLLVWGLTYAMGSESLGCLSIRSFLTSVTFVFIEGFSGVMRIIVGLQYGIGNYKACLDTLRKLSLWMVSIVLAICALVLVYPELLFRVFGYDMVDQNDLRALNIYTFSLVFIGVCGMLEDFLVMIQKPEKASAVTLTHGFIVFIPAFLILLFTSGGTSIWYAYLISSGVAMLLAIYYTLQASKEEKLKCRDKHIASYSITPNMGGTISEEVQQFALHCGLTERKAYKVSLCVDEIAGYCLRSSEGKKYMDIFLTIDKDEVQAVFVDNGEHFDTSALDGRKHLRDMVESRSDDYDEIGSYLLTDFALIHDMVKSVEYQWIWNMNHTTIKI